MDIATLAMAKAYTNSQRLAYEEPFVQLAEISLRDLGDFPYGEQMGEIGLEEGKTYTVILDSGIHQGVCTSYTQDDQTIVNIYRIDKDGDVGFTMCGDDEVYWRSQFEWFDPVRKVDME